MSSGPGALSPAQEAALLRELSAAARHLNRTYFKGALKPVQLSLAPSRGFLGRFVSDPRGIELSREFVLAESWGSIVEVLKHELAHQYVIEVLRELEPAHGPAFRALCERLGIDARARGLPRLEPQPEASKLRERIHKLLALAQSDNRNEAEAAAAAAQRLMLRHNLESDQASQPAAYGFRQLGRITGRVSEWERRLGNVLAEHFFVEIIWVPAYRPLTQKRGSIMEAIGSDENLEIAAYVYDFLERAAERLWRAHQLEQRVSGNRDRLVFYAGVMSGFAQKLSAQASAHKAEGLVWVPHARLSEYTRRRHPYLRTVSHGGQRRGAAFEHGQRAGRDVLLHRGMSRGASAGHTRLLKG